MQTSLPATPASETFEARLELSGPSIMPMRIVVVPPPLLAALGTAAKRVIATFNGGPPERLGLMPIAGGGRYLMLRKDLCRAQNLTVGQLLAVTLTPDPNPDHIDLPAELLEALAAWPEADAAYQPLSGALKRAAARHVADAKHPETRARRAVEMAEKLARGGHPFRAV